MALAIWEETSTVTSGATNSSMQTLMLCLDLVCIFIFFIDIVLLYRFKKDALSVTSIRLRIALIVMMVFNTALCILFPSLWHVSRVLRPLIVVERLRNVKKIASAIVKSAPKILNVLVLVALHVTFFGVLGHVMFRGMTGPASGSCTFAGSLMKTNNTANILSKHPEVKRDLMNRTLEGHRYCSTYNGICEDYFATLGSSLLQMFILLTTANFPDIMMPVYRCQQYYSLFFVVYLMVGLYFLMSLVLAVIYTHFSNQTKHKYRSFFAARENAFAYAHSLLCRARDLSSPAIIGAEDSTARRIFTAISINEWTDMLMSMNKTMHQDVAHAIYWWVCDDGFESKGRARSKDERPELEMTLEVFRQAMKYAMIKVQKVSRPESNISAETRFQKLLAKRFYVRSRIMDIISSKWWDRVFDFLILLNTAVVVTLVMEEELSLSAPLKDGFDVVATVMLFLFIVEVLMKCLGMGIKKFFRNSWFNIIDFVTITIGLTVYIVDAAAGNTSHSSNLNYLAFCALMLRMVRVLRILQSFPEYNRIISTIVTVLPAVFRFFMILLVVIYMYAILGMELFGNRMSGKSNEGNMDFFQSSYHRLDYYANNFDTFPRALVTLFEQMVVNNWPIVMEGAVAATSGWAVVYFISFNLVCVVCVMNVLVAFLIDAYQSREGVDESRGGGLERPSELMYLEGASMKHSLSLPKWHRGIVRAAMAHEINIKMWKLRMFNSTGELYGQLYADGKKNSQA